MYRIGSLLLVLVAVMPASAADRKFDAEAKAKAIAPFVDEQTLAVLHVDLDAIDIDALLKKAEAVTKIEPKDRTAMKEAVAAGLDAFKKAGAHDYFLVASLADFPQQGPFSVLPLARNGDARAVGELVRKMQIHPGNATAEVHGAVVVGSESTIKRLEKLKPTPRPEIAKGFIAMGDGTAHLVLFTTTDTAKVLEDVMPNLPPELGGGSVKVVTRGLKWVAAKVKTDPNVNFEVIVQASDAAAAKQLNELVAKSFKALAANKELKDVHKELAPALEAFTPKVQDDRLVLKLDEKTLVATLKPLVEQVRAAAFRMNSSNNLKQLMLAMHSYHDAFGRLPAVANFGKDGKPLLSWRVHILPFVEQDKLYKEFHLDEPWDSEHNKALVKRMPRVFVSSENPNLAADGRTTYVGVVDKSAVFTGDKTGIRITEITDGTSNTIVVVDADDKDAVIWTKPDDLKLDVKDPKKGLSSRFPMGFLVAMADGSVRLLPKTITKETLNALFTKSGGEVVEIPEK